MKDRKTKRRKSNRRKTTRRKSIGERRNRKTIMEIEVKKFPESQEVMDNPEWFPIGDSAYARVLDESECILVDKTTADEYNEYAEDIDLQAFAQGRKSSYDKDEVVTGWRRWMK